MLSDDALFEKQVKLAELREPDPSKIERARESAEDRPGALLAPLETKLKATIEAIGKEQGYTLIIERKNPYVIYSREAHDITDPVVARFNAEGLSR